MLGAPLIAMGPVDSVGVRVGMYFSIIALGAVAGPPISGAINTATGGFYAVGYYASTSRIRVMHRFAVQCVLICCGQAPSSSSPWLCLRIRAIWSSAENCAAKRNDVAENYLGFLLLVHELIQRQL